MARWWGGNSTKVLRERRLGSRELGARGAGNRGFFISDLRFSAGNTSSGDQKIRERARGLATWGFLICDSRLIEFGPEIAFLRRGAELASRIETAVT